MHYFRHSLKGRGKVITELEFYAIFKIKYKSNIPFAKAFCCINPYDLELYYKNVPLIEDSIEALQYAVDEANAAI